MQNFFNISSPAMLCCDGCDLFVLVTISRLSSLLQMVPDSQYNPDTATSTGVLQPDNGNMYNL